MPHTKKTDKTLLTAAEACALLGVKAQTLYSYVSRGLLRAEVHPGRSGKLYARDEVEALQARSRARSGHGPTAASAMRWGDPVLDSAITLIQAGKIYYRGYALEDLLRRSIGFEQVAELLWTGELPAQKRVWDQPLISGFDELPQGSLSRRLLYGLGKLALWDSGPMEEDTSRALERARAIMQATVSIIFPTPDSATGTLAERIAHACAARRSHELHRAEVIHSIEAALVISADHELNASTFGGRVAASTGGDLYVSLTAALACFSGKHHGLASLDVHKMMTFDTRTLSRKDQLIQYLEANEVPPGFGHRLYPEGDPRVPPLLDKTRILAEKMSGEAQRWWDEVEALLITAEHLGCPKPNLDFGLVSLALVLGLDHEGASALFLIGRMAGWTAHILEQRQQGFLLRPRARYVGREPVHLD